MRTFGFRKSVAASLALVAGLVMVPITVHALATFGPARPTYSWGHPPTQVVFNSITNNPVWGDERYFVKARDINAGTNTYTNSAHVTDGEELLVTTYFNNDSGTNHAKNTMVSVSLPSGSGTNLTETSHITSSNAQYTDSWSTMDFNADYPVTLDYVPGSAKLITNSVNTSLSDSVVSGGTLVGSNSANGDVGPCGDFSGYVVVYVKVHKVPTPTPIPQPKPPKTVVVQKVTSLPNTGAGDTIGLFAGVSALAGIGHYLYRRRQSA